MQIRIESMGSLYVVCYNDIKVWFEEMNDAQDFALKMLTQMGKIGY